MDRLLAVTKSVIHERHAAERTLRTKSPQAGTETQVKPSASDRDEE
jgi:hypothetical protein